MSAWSDYGFPNVRLLNPWNGLRAISLACEEINAFRSTGGIPALTRPYPKQYLQEFLTTIDGFIKNQFSESVVNGKQWGISTIPPHVLSAADPYPTVTRMVTDDFLYQWVRSRYIALNHLTTKVIDLGVNPKIFRQYYGGAYRSNAADRATEMNRILAEDFGWDWRGVFLLNLKKYSDTSYYGECGKCSGRLNETIYDYTCNAPLKFFATTRSLSGYTYDNANFGPVGSAFSWTSSAVSLPGSVSIVSAPLVDWPYSSHLYDDNYNAGVGLDGLWAIDLTGRSYYDPQ